MQDKTKKVIRNEKSVSKISDFTLEDKQKLIGVFAWLIQEDKKQNPELYPLSTKSTYKV